MSTSTTRRSVEQCGSVARAAPAPGDSADLVCCIRLFSGTLNLLSGSLTVALARKGWVLSCSSDLLKVTLHVVPKEFKPLPRIQRPREIVWEHHVV